MHLVPDEYVVHYIFEGYAKIPSMLTIASAMPLERIRITGPCVPFLAVGA